MRWGELHEYFGAEVSGVDLTRPLGSHEAAALRELFAARSLLLFRGQELDGEDRRRLVGSLGPVSTALLPSEPRPGEASFGYKLSNEHAEGQGELRLHSDHCFLDHPLWGISLYAEDVSERCGETLFVSAAAAAERLTEVQRRHLGGLAARHVYRPRERMGEVRDPSVAEEMSATHPLLWPHPVTGVPVLYVNPWMTDQIVGLDKADSAAVLADLFQSLADPAIGYRHRWQQHDFIVWDNVALLHGRTTYDARERRVLARLQLGLPDMAIGH